MPFYPHIARPHIRKFNKSFGVVYTSSCHRKLHVFYIRSTPPSLSIPEKETENFLGERYRCGFEPPQGYSHFRRVEKHIYAVTACYVTKELEGEEAYALYVCYYHMAAHQYPRPFGKYVCDV